MGWSKALRRGAKYFFEFATKMRFVGELQSIRGGFVGISLRNEVFGQPALEFP